MHAVHFQANGLEDMVTFLKSVLSAHATSPFVLCYKVVYLNFATGQNYKYK